MKITKVFLSFLTLISIGLSAHAQYGESIRTGRPGQAIGGFALGQGIFQVQSGIDFNPNTTNPNNKITTIGEDAVFRYGVTETFEVQAAIAHTSETRGFGGFLDTSGISSISLRARSNIIQGSGFSPTIGYQIAVKLPAGADYFKPANAAPKVTVMIGQPLAKNLSLTTNLGLNWNGNTAIPSAFYVFNFSSGIGEKWSVFIEPFGNYSFGSFGRYNHNIDAGFAYLVNKDFQLDFLAGTPLQGDFGNNLFYSIGLSWRANVNRK